MLQIVVNAARDRQRRSRETSELSRDLPDTSALEPNEQLVTAELNRAIHEAIDNLPARQREVAVLVLGEGLNASSVAYILDTTEANVYTCLHLARKRIAQAIGTDYFQRK
jgi:RNA polymerase sigma factor (sigma-70 family)